MSAHDLKSTDFWKRKCDPYFMMNRIEARGVSPALVAIPPRLSPNLACDSWPGPARVCTTPVSSSWRRFTEAKLLERRARHPTRTFCGGLERQGSSSRVRGFAWVEGEQLHSGSDKLLRHLPGCDHHGSDLVESATLRDPDTERKPRCMTGSDWVRIVTSVSASPLSRPGLPVTTSLI